MKHYSRWMRHGSLDDPRPSPLERFYEKVDRGPRWACWGWSASTTSDGEYGQFWWDGRLGVAHRFAYERMIGPIPDGLQMDHLCRNRNCVNPWHLEPVTASENIRRGVSPAAERAAKTHCKRGHEFTEENTYRSPEGWRECRTCSIESSKRWQRENRLRRNETQRRWRARQS